MVYLDRGAAYFKYDVCTQEWKINATDDSIQAVYLNPLPLPIVLRTISACRVLVTAASSSANQSK